MAFPWGVAPAHVAPHPRLANVVEHVFSCNVRRSAWAWSRGPCVLPISQGDVVDEFA
jgi:hypothetical protein